MSLTSDDRRNRPWIMQTTHGNEDAPEGYTPFHGILEDRSYLLILQLGDICGPLLFPEAELQLFGLFFLRRKGCVGSGRL